MWVKSVSSCIVVTSSCRCPVFLFSLWVISNMDDYLRYKCLKRLQRAIMVAAKCARSQLRLRHVAHYWLSSSRAKQKWTSHFAGCSSGSDTPSRRFRGRALHSFCSLCHSKLELASCMGAIFFLSLCLGSTSGAFCNPAVSLPQQARPTRIYTPTKHWRFVRLTLFNTHSFTASAVRRTLNTNTLSIPCCLQTASS